MRNEIVGTTMPVLEFTLDPNDSIISEAGQLSWMGSSIEMTTHTQLARPSHCAVFGHEKRCAAHNAFHDRIPRSGKAGRAGLCRKTSGTYCARRSRTRPRIHDSPPRISLFDLACPAWRGFPAVTGGGDFWRKRFPAATCERTGNGVARTFRGIDRERPRGG